MEITESSSPNYRKIYDQIREKWVKATPEEVVRQNLIHRMLSQLAYPKGLLAVERSLSDLCLENAPSRRVDVVCFLPATQGKLFPLLLVECKESISLVSEAKRQMMGYNFFLKAPFLALAYPEGEEFWFEGTEGWRSLSYLPSYPQLVASVSHVLT